MGRAKHKEIEELKDKIRALENELQQNSVDYEYLFQEANSAFAIHELIYDENNNPVDFKFIRVNSTFEKHIGLKNENISNKNLSEILPNIDKNRIKKYIDITLTGKPAEFEDYLPRLDKYFSVRAFSPKKNVLVVTFFDVTKQKTAEVELRKAKEKAVESDDLKSAFILNLSHEIRTPLNGIIGFADLLPQVVDDKKRQEFFISAIKRSSNQLISIIENLIDISRIDTNQIELSITEFPVNYILDELYADFQLNIKGAKIDFKKNPGLPSDDGIIKSDKERIKQILHNLIENAIKFTSKGFVEYGYKIENNTLIFYVKDSGIGIPDEHKDLVFERFKQVDTNMTRQYGGTGLGLSISKGLVEILGGEIWFESGAGSGTTFYFSLPNTLISKQKNNNMKEKDIPVLVVEDEELNYIFLEEILKDYNPYIKIYHARDGQEGIDIFKKVDGIQVVLMDVKMPVMSGYESTREIKKIDPNITIIAQTAYAMKEDRDKALEAGCDDYVSKPIDREKFYQLLTKYIPPIDVQ